MLLLNDNDFIILLRLAQSGDQVSLKKIVEMYQPCIYKNSIVNGKIDDDCFQELNIKLIQCIKRFKIIV